MPTGQCYGRRRQIEFLAFLEHLEQEISPTIRTIHLVCDNLNVHSGRPVQEWMKSHPHFRFHLMPVRCSWMNQAEQWFSILQRKRFRIVDFTSLEVLEAKIGQAIEEWNQRAHPSDWVHQVRREGNERSDSIGHKNAFGCGGVISTRKSRWAVLRKSD